jgi:hypothetical protein
MPEKVALNVAFPVYGLAGKFEYDYRLLKQPKLEYKIQNGFLSRGKLLRLAGFSVYDINYYDMMENVETKEERRAILRSLLEPHGIVPESEKQQ